eukprot:TRINITY_DN14816_c0_g1_i1.p1 TRINITY_DN14816_c0_g1~~TRINITY_DN14816_c0_g1_i1.p1  ORF type:complete len:467 (-),score=129.64 TRINITY_DN14816_c0_g1_i1:47-1447(-)
MTTFIGSTPVENQIRSLANLLESVQRRESTKNNEGSDDTNQEQAVKQDNTKTTQSQFSLKIDELTTKKDSEKALLEILREPLTEALIRESSEKDIESFFLLTFAIVRRLPTASRQEVVGKVLSVLSTTSPLPTKAQLRLSLTNVFYNSLLPSTINAQTNQSRNKGKKGKKNAPQQPLVDHFSTNFNERLETLKSLITYAFQTNQSQVITPLIPQILSWVKSWHTANPSAISARDYQSLFSLLSSNVRSDSPLFFTIRLQELNSFTSPNNDYAEVLSTNTGIKPLVSELITDIINNEERILEIEELREIPVVQHLASQSGDQEIAQTLTLLSSGSLKDIKSEGVQRFIESNRIDRTKLQHKLQLLELTRLGQAGREVSYEEVRDRLELGSEAGWEDIVESWIVTAISAGIIEARLDQLRRVVIVDRVAQREFGKEQWEQIGSKLTTWRKTVGDLLAMIESRRTAAAS